MLSYRILIGDTRSVPTIESDSVHLVCTSPPYGKAVHYSDNPDNLGNYADDEFVQLMKPAFKEWYRVLKPGRRCVVNIEDLVSSSKEDERMYHFSIDRKFKDLANEVGFVHEDTIVWCKAGVTRPSSSISLGTFPYPGSPVFTHGFEPCYIFRKPGTPDWSHVYSVDREASRLTSDQIWDYSFSSWHISPETKKSYHPAPFPIELPRRFIRLFTFKHEVVYEPFLGSGTTMTSAVQEGRACIGTELGYDAKDGKPWLEHTKEEIGWANQTFINENIIWRVETTLGEVLESIETQKPDKLSVKKGTLDIDYEEKAKPVELPEGDSIWEKHIDKGQEKFS